MPSLRLDATGRCSCTRHEPSTKAVTTAQLRITLGKPVLTKVLGIDGGNVAALQARGEILADLGEARYAMLDLDRLNLQGRPSTRAARGLALAELSDLNATDPPLSPQHREVALELADRGHERP